MNKDELKKHNQKIINEILSNENKWFAGEKIGHEPNCNESAIHYIQNSELNQSKKATNLN